METVNAMPEVENLVDGPEEDRSPGLRIELLVEDAEVMAALASYPEGRERLRFARTALRIGVIAINQAQGRIDSETVRNEGNRLLLELENRLSEYSKETESVLTGTLREYFDPQSGRFSERVERLVCEDGELEGLMKSQFDNAARMISDTLVQHVGQNSPLMQNLSPDESNRFLLAIREGLKQTFGVQADSILKEFSLDHQDSALSRLVRELKDEHGEAVGSLQQRISEVMAEFSMDNDQSALSRLVKRVEDAQKRIGDEFTLDSENSALARMKRELQELIDQQGKAASAFQQEVIATLQAMQTRKSVEAATTAHGHSFQSAGYEFVQNMATRAGDIAEDTGTKTGFVQRCKVGDAVVTLGSDSAASGARIVVEFKEDTSYTLKSTLEEMEIARTNREAATGIFVHSRRTAPAGIEPLARYGKDIVVVWDSEDESSDAYLKAAFLSAKALAVREKVEDESLAADFKSIESSLAQIATQSRHLDESPRVLRRLLILREWSHEQIQSFFPRSPRARRAHGARASQRISVAMGGH